DLLNRASLFGPARRPRPGLAYPPVPAGVAVKVLEGARLEDAPLGVGWMPSPSIRSARPRPGGRAGRQLRGFPAGARPGPRPTAGASAAGDAGAQDPGEAPGATAQDPPGRAGAARHRAGRGEGPGAEEAERWRGGEGMTGHQAGQWRDPQGAAKATLRITK